MTIYEGVGQVTIRELLSDIDSGRTVLPDFQRDFVWSAAATKSLVMSIASEHPAGSILRVRDTQDSFKTRRFEGAPERDVRHIFLVLDGQQRLTSLFQAFYGVGDYRYFIDLRKALSDPDFEDDETIVFKKVGRRAGRVIEPQWEQDLESQARDWMLPLSVFQKREGGFWRWVTDARQKMDAETGAQFESKMIELHGSHLKFFEQYQFPVVTLRDSVSATALCTIFETLNLGGVRLTLFELMTARAWKHDINLRERWDAAVEKYPIISDYDIDPYAAVQALALLAKESCQKSDVLDLSAAEIDGPWVEVIEQLAAAFRMLRSDCGIVNKSWLPSPSMMGPLTAIMVKMAEARGPELGARREKVLRWVWCAIFGRRYEAAANTRAEKDYKEMVAWFAGGPVPEAISQFRMDRESLFEVSTKASPVYKGVISLILSSAPRAKDFHTREIIEMNLVASGAIDDHHIFPRAFLAREKGIDDKKLVNCVLNKTLIDRTTNQMISDRAPSEYLADLGSEDEIDAILETHLMSIGPESPVRNDDFGGFLQDRADRVMAEIQRVTGSINAPGQ